MRCCTVSTLLLSAASALRAPVSLRSPRCRPLRSDASDTIVDVEAVVEDIEADVAAVMAAGGDVAYPSVVSGIELVLESAIPGVAGGHVVKMRCECPGAAVLHAFDEIRAQAGSNLAEPGFRPGEVPPWIKTQMTEFSLTTVMEDYVQFAVDAQQFSILESTGAGEDVIRWNEDPNAEAKTYVLGDVFTFHAAFNATVPAVPVDGGGGSADVADLYKITEQMTNRAATILAAGGKVPGLLNAGGGSKKKGSSKKKKTKKPGKKKR